MVLWRLPQEWGLLIAAALVRIVFIAFGQWQDAHMEVRYTDIDYQVFTDAADFVSKGRSPFDRETYRYSPLLAFLLVPNILLHPVCGKLIFSLADLLAGHLIYKILALQGVNAKMQTICTALWLFNPFTFTIATRGNCEALVCCMMLRIIWCLLTGSLVEAAVWYGVVVHFRIYPIIYVLAILVALDGGLLSHLGSRLACTDSGKAEQENARGSCFLLKLINRNQIIFGAVSGGAFFLLTGACYWLYGNQFLHEALLYHLTRTDPRHNFSIYFYHVYLHQDYPFTLAERLFSFVPQFLVQSMLTAYFAKDLPFCFFIQTVAFVAFNKVITAQYFVWFFCLFPLILPWTKLTFQGGGLLCMLVWIVAQVHWLLWAYALEFQGYNVFFQLWLASLIFFCANVFVLATIIRHHSSSCLSLSGGNAQKYMKKQ